jgi:hypothetical protein
VKQVVALESAKQDGYPQAQAFESTEQSRSNPRSNPQTGGKNKMHSSSVKIFQIAAFHEN